MNLSSRYDGQEASLIPRTYIRPALHAELSHLDLTGRVSINNLTVFASGTFGDIAKSQCTLDGRKITVAVKRLRFYLKEDIDLLFEKEIYVWSKLDHPNILSLLGFAFEESSGYPLLVSEWMANGSSLNYVKNNSDCDLIRLVSGIAEGLAYLHDKDIVHSDIKPDNVVVTDAGDARICDFGGSRIATASKSIAKPTTGIRGTPRYLSHELVALLDQYPRHTKESDVWAFGMTVFALLNREHPYALLGDAQVMEAIVNRELPSFNFSTSRLSEKAILQNVCDLCWDFDPSHRTSIAYIIVILKNFEPKQTDTLYRLPVELSTMLDTIIRCTDHSSGIYQHLLIAKKLCSSLQYVFVEELEVDGSLDRLMHSMKAVLSQAISYPALESWNQTQTIIRLLQKIVESCLFVKQYSNSRLKGQTNQRWKLDELNSFFVAFQLEMLSSRARDFRIYTPSQVFHTNDSELRNRLNPGEFDVKGQQVCLLGTRVTVQERILECAFSDSSRNIFWLHGAAGSGKSTVVASVSEHIHGINRLGASLTFKRGSSDLSSIIPTIAFKLASFDSSIESLILAETSRDIDIVNASLTTQFEKLLLGPLNAAESTLNLPIIIVLDGLDGCGAPGTREAFLQVFLRGLPRMPSSFRFLISSQREQNIRRAFSLQSESVTLLELNHTSLDSRRDVQFYLNHEMRKIFEYKKDRPDEESMESIESTLAGHFDWASKVVKLASEDADPLQKLEELASANLFEQLNLLQVIRDDVLDALHRFDLSKNVNLKKRRVIGTGAFSDVFKVYTPPTDNEKGGYVAAKQLRFETNALNMIYLFENEIYVWSKLEHSNVLPLLGFVINEENGYPLLITEWMPNGSAGKYVRANNNCDLLRLVTGVAAGLSYLHENNVTHSDLKPENILVSSSGDALICDFGAARIIAASKDLKSFGDIGTLHYMAYELLAEEGESIAYSPSTDVWAFGMTVFELLTQEHPYHQYKIEAHAEMAIKEKKLPTLPELSTWGPQRLRAKESLWDILQSCWEFDPSKRPNMATIRDEIQDRIDEENVIAMLFPTDSDFMGVDVS